MKISFFTFWSLIIGLLGSAASSQAQITNGSAEAVTTEIQALARGLNNDPLRIYNYVHDHIRFVPYFGSHKGAELTLLARSGNDFDQCALLVSLLNAAGYAPVYQFGFVQMPYNSTNNDSNDMQHWLQLTQVNTNWSNTQSFVSNYLFNRGWPNNVVFQTSDTNTLVFQRVWVKLVTGGVTYYLDPSFKVSQAITGTNLATAMGLNTNDLMTAAGGTNTAVYTQSLNEANLNNKLLAYATNLMSVLQSNYPNATLAQVLGGQQILPSTNSSLSQSLGFPIITNFSAYSLPNMPVLTWTNQPTNMMAVLNFALGTSNYVWATPQLQGQRLSLTFSTSGTAQLWQDDTQLQQSTPAPSGGLVSGTLNINFPWGYWDTTNNVLVTNSPSSTYKMNFQYTNANYALTYGFDEDPNWLRHRQAQLALYRAQGLADSSRQVLTETLNIMSHQWVMQSCLVNQLIGQQTSQLVHYNDFIGRAAQETGNGYYVDLHEFFAPFANNYNDWQSGKPDACSDVTGYFMSGLEHAVIEQSQPTNFVAASTVKMLEVANANASKLYLLNSGNWATYSGNLANYGGSLTTIYNNYIANNFSVLLPDNGSLYLTGTSGYKGAGFMARRFDVHEIDSLIAGGYSGGFAPYKTFTPNSGWVYQSGWNAPKFLQASPPGTGTRAGDPVDMADGSFTVEKSDLTLGQIEPRGINFGRVYGSNKRFYNLAGMANGWMHNYFLNLTVDSGMESSLGWATPQQAVPILVATCAALNLYQTNATPKNWAVTALIAKWGADQLVNNAVNVNFGNESYQFIRQPDGSYTPPANCTMTLSQASGLYTVQERHGRSFQFSTNNVVTNIADQFGNNLVIGYNSSNWVSGVTDWKGRSLAFNYTGTPARLTSVSDNATRSVSYGYATNALGQWDLVSVTNADGYASTFLYDTNHQITAAINELSQVVTSNLFDSFGRVTTQYTGGLTSKTWQILWSGWQNIEQDPTGAQRTFFYDDASRLAGIQDALSNTSQMFYDGQNHVTMTVSPLNETNLYGFDGSNNVIYAVDPLNNTNSFYYDSLNNLIKAVDPRGQPSTFGYNSGFKVTGATNGAGNWVTYAYGGDGSRTGRTDAGGSTVYSTDSNGQLSAILYPSSLASVHFTNNLVGDVISTLNGNGFFTQFKYDARRALTNIIGPTNLTTSLAYDGVGNLQTRTDPRGFTATNVWSATRRLLAILLPSTPQGSPTLTNIYDTRDWLSSRLDPLQQATLFTNDSAHRLVSFTDPLTRTTQNAFDNDGRLLTSTDSALETTFLKWSSRGQMVQLIDPATNIVGKLFDGAGNQTTLTNRDTNVWTFAFDGANHLTNTVTPTSRKTAQTWNSRGLLATVAQPSTHTTTLSYDAMDRLSTRADLVGTTTFQYDLDNNVTNVVENSVSLTSTFDAYDRPVKYVDGAGNVFHYQYDANNNLTNLIYPGGNHVYYLYDSLNRLTNVVDWAGRKTSYIYDLAGRVTNVTRPNGTVRVINYDAAGQTASILEETSSGAGIAYFQFTNDLAGRIQSEFVAPVPHAYSLGTRTMTYDADDRLSNVASTTVTNDLDGNMIYGPGTNSAFGAWTYDARNRLLSGGGLSYGYDALGSRIWMTNGATATQFIINPNAAVSQTLIRVVGGTTNYYVYGLGLIYHVDTSGNTYTYHYDSRGSTVAITSSSASVTDRVEYSPYGTITYRSGTTDTPFLFNGRYGVMTDPNGLLFMRARYYNPYICRFINADPSGFGGGLNLFAFANGNPVSLIDPFGLGAVGESSGYSWIGQVNTVSNPSFLPSGPLPYYSGTGAGSDLAAGLFNLGSALDNALSQGGQAILSGLGMIGYGMNNIEASVAGPGGFMALGPAGGAFEDAAAAFKEASALAAITGAAEESSQTYQIMNGVRRAVAANLTGATTIQAEVVDANMVSQGVQQVPISLLLSPKDVIDLNGSGLDRWNRVLQGTQTGATLPPILITPGGSGIPIGSVTIGHP